MHKYIHHYITYNCNNSKRNVNKTWETGEVNYAYPKGRILCIHSRQHKKAYDIISQNKT